VRKGNRAGQTVMRCDDLHNPEATGKGISCPALAAGLFILVLTSLG